MRNYSGLHIQRRLIRDQQVREGRIFVAGFWAGLIPGLAVAVACVVLALYLRG